MAITQAERQITWAAANSLSIAAAGNGESDEFNLPANTIAAQITLKATNNGTAVSGDTLDFYLLQTSGDPDGTGTDEFDTPSHAAFLGRVDTFVEDGQTTVRLPIPQKGGKVRAVNNAASNGITVSATITEQVAA